MTLREFIRKNREEIDAVIDSRLNYVPKEATCYCSLSGTNHRHEEKHRRNDEERRQWVYGDEYLYQEAVRAGVPI